MFNSISLTESEKSKFLGKTYGWMGIALLISAVSAFLTFNSRTLFSIFVGNGIGYMGLVIAELVLVFWLTASIRKISVGTAILGFIAYSVINGMTLSTILMCYTTSSITSAFLSCSVMFFAMALYGTMTEKNLMGWGRYLSMGLIGILIASLMQFILGFFFGGLRPLNFLISIASVVLFTALTAYDAQKVIRTAENATNSDDYNKVAIIAALELYLDFINLFLALLRIFGRRRS